MQRRPTRADLATALLVLVLGGEAIATAQVTRPDPKPLRDPSQEDDLRGQIVLDYDCKSKLNRRAVSLFASGTIRLRTEGLGERGVRLAELSPIELQGYINRLREEDLGETDARSVAIEGDWIEQCKLDLKLPNRPIESFVFDRYASLSLALSRVLTVARELERKVDEASPPDKHLPVDYEPRNGDILERSDGARFRVRGYTLDKLGIELTGLEQPLTLFLRRDELFDQFVAVLERRER